LSRETINDEVATAVPDPQASVRVASLLSTVFVNYLLRPVDVHPFLEEEKKHTDFCFNSTRKESRSKKIESDLVGRIFVARSTGRKTSSWVAYDRTL
jgi:hypothetical protein